MPKGAASYAIHLIDESSEMIILAARLEGCAVLRVGMFHLESPLYGTILKYDLTVRS